MLNRKAKMLEVVDADDGGVAEVGALVELDAGDELDTIRHLQELVASLKSELALRTEALRELEERKGAFERAMAWAAELEAERSNEGENLAAAHAQEISELRKQHAEELAAERALRDEELAGLADVEEEATKSIRSQHTSELAARARAHAADLQKMRAVHAEDLARRERDLSALHQRVADLELSLADEREGRAEDAVTHAELLARAKENAIESLAKHDRNHADMLALERKQNAANAADAARARKEHEQISRERDEALRLVEAKEEKMALLAADLEEEIAKRETQNERHAKAVAEHDSAMKRLRSQLELDHAQAMDKLDREHQKDIEDRKSSHADEFAERVRAQYAELAEIEKRHIEELKAVRRQSMAPPAAESERKLAEVAAEGERKVADRERRLADAEHKLAELDRQLAERERAHDDAMAALREESARRLEDVEGALAAERQLRADAVESRTRMAQLVDGDRTAAAERIEMLEATLMAEREAHALEIARADETVTRFHAVTDKAIARGDEALRALAAVKAELAEERAKKA